MTSALGRFYCIRIADQKAQNLTIALYGAHKHTLWGIDLVHIFECLKGAKYSAQR